MVEFATSKELRVRTRDLRYRRDPRYQKNAAFLLDLEAHFADNGQKSQLRERISHLGCTEHG